MKKLLLFLIIGSLIISGLGASAINIENYVKQENTESSNRATHTVLGEYGTATWCGFCRYAHGALKELFSEGQLDFYYVSLVSDKNSKAAARTAEFNLYGYPTVWWDGGFDVDVGAGSVSGAKSTYTSSINSAANRAVYDVEIDIQVRWTGGTEMDVDVEVTNNEDSSYDGRIRVYITEKVSSMNWKDTGGSLYTYAFLDWAFNKPISIPSDDSWSDTMTWDGSSVGFPSVTPENTWVIAAVFNDEPHQGYSYPPSSNPFTAYYPDAVVGTGPIENQQPDKPIITGPDDGEPGIEYEYTIEITDPDEDDMYVWLDWGDETQGWLGPYESGTILDMYHTWDDPGIYDVKVKTRDVNYQESQWSDSIIVSIGNLAPTKPEIDGPTSGLINSDIEFTFVATDANNDQLLYFIDWGDGNTEEWIGPYDSGEEVVLTHSWNEVKRFSVKAKVKDPDGLETGWTYHNINIPRTRLSQNSYIAQLFERFSVLYQILNHILG